MEGSLLMERWMKEKKKEREERNWPTNWFVRTEWTRLAV